MKTWIMVTLFIVAIHSIAVAATVYIGPEDRSLEFEYSNGAFEYRKHMEDLWLEMGIPTFVSATAAANTIAIAENITDDGVINTVDLRSAIVFRFLEKGTAANAEEVYIQLCPAEESLGIVFGNEPWTDEEDWGYICP